MAISRLAISNPSATTDTLLHTATRSSLASIIATNKASTVAEVRVWIIPTGQDATPANWSYIAYDADITATNSLETFRFPVMTGDKIYVRSTTADVSFQIMGIYETGADTYVYAQSTQPVAPQIGDIWVDTASNVPSIDNTTVYRWSKTAVGGETSLTGTGNDLSVLKYIAGYEQVYLNGVLLAKTLDYTATNGTSITSLTALSAGDIVEVISPYAIELTDVYTKSISDNKYQTKVSNGLNLIVPTGATNGTVGANGSVTIGSNVNSVTVAGAFNSTYDNYLITVSNFTHSYANDNIAVQLRTGSTTSTSGYYGVLGYWGYTGTPGAATQNNAAQWMSVGRTLAVNNKVSFGFNLFQPFLPNKTTIASLGVTGGDITGNYTGFHDNATSYDQLVIFGQFGNLTGGTIRIYGYNNGGA